MTATFTLRNETKGAVRYEEVAGPDGAVIGTLYLRKSALQKPYPQTITVSVE